MPFCDESSEARKANWNNLDWAWRQLGKRLPSPPLGNLADFAYWALSNGSKSFPGWHEKRQLGWRHPDVHLSGRCISVPVQHLNLFALQQARVSRNRVPPSTNVP